MDQASEKEIPYVLGVKDFQTPGKPIRLCKIVGTIGPSSSDEDTLRELIEAGLNIARLNFSHGDHEVHKKAIDRIRKISAETKRNVAILQDLQGPKIRCGKLLNDQITVESGEVYSLIYGSNQKEESIIPIDYRELANDVSPGQKVMMDDGLLLFEIMSIEGETVKVKCLEGGKLKSRKGVNFPDSKLSLPAMTEKDSKDLLFGIGQGVDFVALSFVQDPNDVVQCKKMIKALGADIPVVSKIEKLPAIESIEEIAKVSDALMVARGDLGVEGNVERVPAFQQRIVQAAASHSKPVIIATQMLESMIQNPRATLAEVADVANAVLDGVDCTMLSGEVASGKYPVKCVEKMASIIEQVESWTFRKSVRYSVEEIGPTDQVWEDHEALARVACETADSLSAKAIVCLTLTGSIARLIAKWRPRTPIIAISPRKDVMQRLNMVWGVYCMQNPMFYNTDVLLQDLPQTLKSLGVVNSGDTVVITAGIPIKQMKPTNMLKINRIP